MPKGVLWFSDRDTASMPLKVIYSMILNCCQYTEIQLILCILTYTDIFDIAKLY